jgi:phosphatidylglycerophosphate synthase
MKKLFENACTFLADRFTARHAYEFEVRDKVITRANMVTMSGIIATIVCVIQVAFNMLPGFIPLTNLIPPLSDVIDGKIADANNEHSKLGKIIDPTRDFVQTFGILWIFWIIGGDIVLWPVAAGVAFELMVLVLACLVAVPHKHLVLKMHFMIQWIVGFLAVAQGYWIGEWYISLVSLAWIIVGTSMATYLYCSYAFLFKNIGSVSA